MKIKIQTNSNDCGLYIIQSIYKHLHQKNINIDILRNEAIFSNNGISLGDLRSLSLSHGILIDIFEAEVKDVFTNKDKYFIALVNNNHYIIIKINHDYVDVWDPAKGEYKLLFKEFTKVYSGIIMTFKANNEYRPPVKKTNNIWWHVLSSPSIFSTIFLSIIINIVLTITSGFFLKLVFDLIIPNQLTKMLLFLFLIFSSLALIRGVNIFLKNMLVKKISINVEWRIFLSFKESLNTINVSLLKKYSFYDIFKKEVLIGPVSAFISSTIFMILTDAIYLIISSSILAWISIKLFMIVFSSSLILIIISLFFQKTNYHLYQAAYESNLLFLNKKQDYIKNIFNSKEKMLANYLNNNLNKANLESKIIEYKSWLISSLDFLFKNIINYLFPLIIVFIAINFVFKNHLTIGNMMLFLSIQGFFINAISSLSNYLLTLPQNRKIITMVNEILHAPIEEINHHGIIVKNINNIEVRDLSFSYDQKIINIKHYAFKKKNQIHGKNGVGKSTLLQLLSFFLKGEGNILINNIKYEFYNLDKLRDRIFHVKPESTLFNDSVFNNIVFDNEELKKTFHKNIKKYNLEKLFENSFLNLSQNIIDNGNNLSSGQKQIILLLRLLTKKYDLILLDEAIENIAPENIVILKKALNNFQKNAIWIEVSNSKKFLFSSEVIDFAKINKC